MTKLGVPWTLKLDTASLFIWTSWVAAAGSARQASVLALGTPRIAAKAGKPAMSDKRLELRLRALAFERLQLRRVGGLDLADPVLLAGVEGAGQAEEARRPAAARDQRGGDVIGIADEVAEFERDEPLLDVIVDQRLRRPAPRTRRSAGRSSSRIRSISPWRWGCP